MEDTSKGFPTGEAGAQRLKGSGVLNGMVTRSDITIQAQAFVFPFSRLRRQLPLGGRLLSAHPFR